ncbi:MAG: hypothetical protein KGH80_06665, partial [Xanthomonadaceae bacterium]|nr:hypothetical protein [Xanthomonadaceae bacterium]
NPVILFFPLLAGLLLVRLGQWRCAAVLVVCFSSIVAGWGWRNAGLPYEYGATRRAAENFVEGSIPLYMRAFNSRWVSPDAKRIVDVADNETALLLHDPAAGMNAVFDRMRQQPGAYLSWYLLQKPWKLWDWGIVIGTGDIYYPVTQRSPLERIAVLRAMKQLFEWVNPAFFVLAMFAALWLLLRVWVCRTIPFMAAAMAVFVIYVTGVHVVFQAEPRYSVPYRPEEVLLALTALAWVSALWSRRSSSASLTGNPAA